MGKVTLSAGVALVAVVAMLAGCVVAIGNSGADGDEKHAPGSPAARMVPRDATLIGFGRSVVVEAPTRGTLYVVRASNDELLYAATVAADERIRISDGHIAHGDHPLTQLQMITSIDERYELYFRPTSGEALAIPETEPK